MNLKLKVCVLMTQIIFSSYTLLVCLPNLGQDSRHEAIVLATLAYWFPSPISGFNYSNKENV